MTKLFGLLNTYRIQAELVVLAALLVLLGAQTWRLHSEQTAHARDKAAFAVQVAEAARERAEAESAARIEEQRRLAQLQEKVDAATKLAQQAEADRVIADAVSGRLRERFAAAVAAAREAARNPPAAPTSETASADDLPADMFRRVLEVTQQYRDAAESALRAGELAEQLYDGLGK